MFKYSFLTVAIFTTSFVADAQNCDAIKTENGRLKYELAKVRADYVMLKAENFERTVGGKNSNVGTKTGTGQIQSSNDIDFELISATGNKKDQTVTVVIKFTNKAANKEGFLTPIESFSSPEGEEFLLKGRNFGGYRALSTDAPLQGTFVFEGVLPKVTSIKLLRVPFQFKEANFQPRYVEFKNVTITWK